MAEQGAPHFRLGRDARLSEAQARGGRHPIQRPLNGDGRALVALQGQRLEGRLGNRLERRGRGRFDGGRKLRMGAPRARFQVLCAAQARDEGIQQEHVEQDRLDEEGEDQEQLAVARRQPRNFQLRSRHGRNLPCGVNVA
ncbi:hypothetical protein D3C72_2002070 [compost metagenome]